MARASINLMGCRSSVRGIVNHPGSFCLNPVINRLRSGGEPEMAQNNQGQMPIRLDVRFGSKADIEVS
jgi:hypothetical protein